MRFVLITFLLLSCGGNGSAGSDLPRALERFRDGHEVQPYARWSAPGLDLSDVSTARVAGQQLDEATLRERCRHAYATHYRAPEQGISTI